MEIGRLQETGYLYHEVLDYLRERAYFVDELAPAHLCSIGSVIANIRQHDEKEGPFWFIKGVPEDLRVPIVNVAPSGGSKSYMMKFFIQDGATGLMHLHSGWEGKITEAGFIGTIDREGEMIYGAAYEFRTGIMAFHELRNIFLGDDEALMNQVMEVLTEGVARKRLAGGSNPYPTLCNIWGGIQPARYDMTGGMMRRFQPVSKIWTPGDLRMIQVGRRDRGRDSRYNLLEIETFRRKFEECQRKFDPTEVIFEDAMFDYLELRCPGPHSQRIIEFQLLGKKILETPGDSTMVIEATLENKSLIDMLVDYQNRIAIGSDLSLVIDTINGFTHTPSENELFQMFHTFGYTMEVFFDLVTECKKYKLVFVNNGLYYTRATRKNIVKDRQKGRPALVLGGDEDGKTEKDE